MAKILNRVLGVAGVAILASSLGVLAACGEQADENASAKETVSNANVALTLYDENGIEVGHGSGVLIAEKTVLTSAHLIAGKGKWTVTAADGRKVNGIRGQTFDWKRYDSLMAHPRKHDVGVVFLDRPIQLASYPKIATVAQPNGEQVMRVRSEGKGFQFIDAKLDRVRQMPNAYVTDMPASETLDTGGAVVNGKGEIVGIVTGRGMQTGKLYIAKLGEVVGWLSDKANCGGAAKSGGALSIRTIGTPTKPGCTKDAGSNICKDGGSSGGSSGSSGGSSGTGSSSGASGSSSGSSGDDGNGGSGGNDSDSGKCEVGGGYEYPGGGGSTGVSSPVSSNGSSENGSLGGSGNGGAGSGTGGSGTGGGTGTGENGGSENGTTPGTGTGGSGSGTGTGTGGGTGTGENGGSENGTTPGSGTGGAGSGNGTGSGAGTPGGANQGSNTGSLPGANGGGAGSAGLDEEVCEGENDNPDICPPETLNCEGPQCGGANSPADNTIDYGACGCGSTSTNGSSAVILR